MSNTVFIFSSYFNQGTYANDDVKVNQSVFQEDYVSVLERYKVYKVFAAGLVSELTLIQQV